MRDNKFVMDNDQNHNVPSIPMMFQNQYAGMLPQQQSQFMTAMVAHPTVPGAFVIAQQPQCLPVAMQPSVPSLYSQQMPQGLSSNSLELQLFGGRQQSSNHHHQRSASFNHQNSERFYDNQPSLSRHDRRTRSRSRSRSKHSDRKSFSHRDDVSSLKSSVTEKKTKLFVYFFWKFRSLQRKNNIEGKIGFHVVSLTYQVRNCFKRKRVKTVLVRVPFL
jgi:hypothetical protein